MQPPVVRRLYCYVFKCLGPYSCYVLCLGWYYCYMSKYRGYCSNIGNTIEVVSYVVIKFGNSENIEILFISCVASWLFSKILSPKAIYFDINIIFQEEKLCTS